MPDRYGDSDDDADTMREEYDLEQVAEQARRKRSHLTSVRPTGNSRKDRDEAHRRRVADQLAAADRRVAGIPGCDLCDDDGELPTGFVCDHIDRTMTYARGRYLIRNAMGWDDTPTRLQPSTCPSHRAVTERTGNLDPNHPRPCRDAPGRSQNGTC